MSCEVAYPWMWPLVMLVGAACGGIIGAVLVDLSTWHRTPHVTQHHDSAGDAYGE